MNSILALLSVVGFGLVAYAFYLRHQLLKPLKITSPEGTPLAASVASNTDAPQNVANDIARQPKNIPNEEAVIGSNKDKSSVTSDNIDKLHTSLTDTYQSAPINFAHNLSADNFYKDLFTNNLSLETITPLNVEQLEMYMELKKKYLNLVLQTHRSRLNDVGFNFIKVANLSNQFHFENNKSENE